MALFKPLFGDSSRISFEQTPFRAGYVYFTTDGFLYFDINIGTESQPNNQRIKLNAGQAESILGHSIVSAMNNNTDTEIPTSKAVLDQLAQYALSTHSHDDKYYTESEIDSKITTLNNSISGKADAVHNHAISEVENLQTTLNGKVPTSRKVNGKALTADITLSASDIGAATASDIATAKSQANTYTDEKIALLVNNSSAAVDSINELAAAMEDNADAIEALQSIASGHASKDHTHDNYASSVEVTGSGNAITAISQSGNKITATKGSTFLTAHPTVTKSTDGTSSVSPKHGETFTAVDSITRDGNGHVTKINTKTVTLPSETTLNKGTDTTDTAQTLTYGGTFTAMVDTTVSGHTITDKNKTFTMPSVDSELSNSSTNPVQNKVINSALAGKSNTNHTHDYLPLSGGNMTGDIAFGTDKGVGVKWGARNNNGGVAQNPFMGYCSESGDGTFVVGSLLGKTYHDGLAIGGSSGNLLWKGAQIATKNDIPNIPVQSVNGKTGAVVLSASDVGAATTAYVDSAIANANTQNVEPASKTTTWNADETVYTTTWTIDGVAYREVLTEVSDTQYTKQYYINDVLNGTWTTTIDETNRTSSVVYTA